MMKQLFFVLLLLLLAVPAAAQDDVPAGVADVLEVTDQRLGSNNGVTVPRAVSAGPGWLVIHADADGTFGQVIGQSPLTDGENTDVEVVLQGPITSTLWAMIHVDDGAVGTYEFDGQSGLDAPVTVDGNVATLPFDLIPAVQAGPQLLIPSGDADIISNQFLADRVVSDGPGWLVVHADGDGAPGPVIGFTAVNDGLTTEVIVELDQEGMTPTVWPMLHVDDGAVGAYEFDGQSGLDAPVTVDGSVLTFPVPIAPSIIAQPQDPPVNEDGAIIMIDTVLADADGWLVIHENVDNAPGPVLGQTQVLDGINTDLTVAVDPNRIGEQVWPMLHYDTGEFGNYEFNGGENGLDLPVRVNGDVVVVPLPIVEEGEMAATEEAPDDMMATEEAMLAQDLVTNCLITPAGDQNINVRSAPAADAPVLRSISVGGEEPVVAQVQSGGFTWYQLADEGWTRGDLFLTQGPCDNVPTVEMDMAGDDMGDQMDEGAMDDDMLDEADPQVTPES